MKVRHKARDGVKNINRTTSKSELRQALKNERFHRILELNVTQTGVSGEHYISSTGARNTEYSNFLNWVRMKVDNYLIDRAKQVGNSFVFRGSATYSHSSNRIILKGQGKIVEELKENVVIKIRDYIPEDILFTLSSVSIGVRSNSAAVRFNVTHGLWHEGYDLRQKHLKQGIERKLKNKSVHIKGTDIRPRRWFQQHDVDGGNYIFTPQQIHDGAHLDLQVCRVTDISIVREINLADFIK